MTQVFSFLLGLAGKVFRTLPNPVSDLPAETNTAVIRGCSSAAAGAGF